MVTPKKVVSMKEHMEKMLSVIGSTVASWVKDNSEEELARKVRAQLDEKQEDIIFRLLGFDNSWGNWEVNSFGSKNNTAVKEYLHKHQQAAIEKWLEEIELPSMPAAMVKSVKRTYLNTLEYEVRERVKRLAFTRADAIAAKLVEQCISDEGATDNYFKLIALLEQTNTQQT